MCIRDSLCPIRPLNPDGIWGAKQRRVYREDGKFDAVPTTDWGKPEALEVWRKAWAELCNAKFKDKGLECRSDHRSYEKQGIDQAPTVHEGVAVRQMEAKGMTCLLYTSPPKRQGHQEPFRQELAPCIYPRDAEEYPLYRHFAERREPFRGAGATAYH